MPSKDLRVKRREPCQLLGISLVALAIAVRDRPQIAYIRHDHFVANSWELLAD
jgi:hypothetical protein